MLKVNIIFYKSFCLGAVRRHGKERGKKEVKFYRCWNQNLEKKNFHFRTQRYCWTSRL